MICKAMKGDVILLTTREANGTQFSTLGYPATKGEHQEKKE